jgi:hypothetical protein
METILLIGVIGLLMFKSFKLGLEMGKNNTIKSPIEKMRERKEEKEQKEIQRREREIEEINAYNIEIYDGTSAGQKSFPG